MKIHLTTSLIFFLFTITFSQEPLEFFECASSTPDALRSSGDAQYGRDFTPKGDFKALVVFAAFEGYVELPLENWPSVPDIILPENGDNNGLPNYVDQQTGSFDPLLFNEVSDFDSELINDPSNLSVSKIFNLMSRPHGND